MRPAEVTARHRSLVEPSSGVTRAPRKLSDRHEFGKICGFVMPDNFLILFSFNQKVVVVDTNH